MLACSAHEMPRWAHFGTASAWFIRKLSRFVMQTFVFKQCVKSFWQRRTCQEGNTCQVILWLLSSLRKAFHNCLIFCSHRPPSRPVQWSLPHSSSALNLDHRSMWCRVPSETSARATIRLTPVVSDTFRTSVLQSFTSTSDKSPTAWLPAPAFCGLAAPSETPRSAHSSSAQRLLALRYPASLCKPVT